jgi:hypothetical protein
MAIHFTTAVDGDTLRIKTSGFDESLAEVQECGMAIIRACQAADVTRVLCNELDLEYRLSVVDTFLVGEFISEHAPAVAKAAIVCNPKYVTEARFWETVVVNRGLQVRVFTDTDAAACWLRDSVRPSGSRA